MLVVFYGGQALFQPAFAAIVPDVVPRDQLLQANALREVMEPLGMRFGGPALGGFLIALFGVGEALLVDAATFVVSAIAVSLIVAPAGEQDRARLAPADLSEGFAYVRAHSWLWGTLAGAALFLLITSARSRCCSRTSSGTTSAATPRPSAPCSRPAGAARSRAALILSRTGCRAGT